MAQNNPFNDFLDSGDLDMEGIDGAHCLIMHPLLDEVLDEIVADESGHENCWEGLLTDRQNQLRHCLTTEVYKRVIENTELELSAPMAPTLYVLTLDQIQALIMTSATWAIVADQRLNGDVHE